MHHVLNEREARDRSLFNRIAKRYVQKDLLPAHRLARQLRLTQTLAITDCPPNPTILELGCGAGFAAEYLRGRFQTYHGIDYSSDLIALAKHFQAQNQVTFECANIDDWEPPYKYDLVFMIGVLHHLDNPTLTLRRAANFLKPTGWLVANEPQKGNPLITIARNLRKNVDDRYSDEQVEFTAGKLYNIFSDAGLTQIRLKSQGIISTPFAEVTLPLQVVCAPLSYVSCEFDRFCERHLMTKTSRLAWNVIAAGQPGKVES